MVKEHQYVFDVQDITELVYACPECKHKMVCQVRSEHQPAEKCPSCDEPILARDYQGINPNITFLKNLRAVLMSKNVQLKLVVPDPAFHGKKD